MGKCCGFHFFCLRRRRTGMELFMKRLLSLVLSLVLLVSLVSFAAAKESDDIISCQYKQIPDGDEDFYVDELDGVKAYPAHQCNGLAVRYYWEIYGVDMFVGVKSPFLMNNYFLLEGVEDEGDIPDEISGFYHATVPKKGDIVYWSATRRGKSYAHTALVKSYSDGVITLIEQNWNYNGKAAYERKIRYPSENYVVYTLFPEGQPEQDRSVMGFTDVLPVSYYAEAVAWAVDKKITTGTGDATFSPKKNVNRGQAVTFLWRAVGEPEPVSTVNPFTDVSEGDYYYKAVLWAVEYGITNGTSVTTFSPAADVKRGQMITFLYRTVGEPGRTGEGAWYEDAENWAKYYRILSGTSVEYETNGDCPRSDVVFYLWKVLKYYI